MFSVRKKKKPVVCLVRTGTRTLLTQRHQRDHDLFVWVGRLVDRRTGQTASSSVEAPVAEEEQVGGCRGSRNFIVM